MGPFYLAAHLEPFSFSPAMISNSANYILVREVGTGVPAGLQNQ